MVRLNRIYTRTGDDGTTGLGNGERRSKANARVESYGTVDELNAVLGLARLHAEGEVDALQHAGAAIGEGGAGHPQERLGTEAHAALSGAAARATGEPARRPPARAR